MLLIYYDYLLNDEYGNRQSGATSIRCKLVVIFRIRGFKIA